MVISICLLDRFGTLLLYKVAVGRESGRKLYQYWLMIVLLMAVARAHTAFYVLVDGQFCTYDNRLARLTAQIGKMVLKKVKIIFTERISEWSRRY